MASDVSSDCTEVNELFDDEKEEGEISLEDVSSSEEGQLYKYPPRTYPGQCPYCLSMQSCATWCRSLTVNKVNNIKRDGGVQGKENRGNRHYDKEPAGVSNVHGKHAGLYSTLQEKNDDEGQNDLVPISSDSDMELVGLESAKKEKKRRRSHKKRRKKSPIPPDPTLALSIKESIHRLEPGLFKKEAPPKSSHSRPRYTPEKKSALPRRHSRLSPVMMRPRRPRSPLLRKSSPLSRQRKLPPPSIPVVMNQEEDLPLVEPSARGSVNKLLKKVRNLEPFSSRSKEKGSSLKDKLSNIIKSEKKDSSTEETSCKESKPTDFVDKKDSKNENKCKELDKKKEKNKEIENEVVKEKEKSKEKLREKDKAKEKKKSKIHENEKVKQKEHQKSKTREKKKVKDDECQRDKTKIIEKDKIIEKVKIKEEKEDEKIFVEKNNEKDDDDDLILLRQMALDTKQKKNTLIKPEKIKIEPIDYEEIEEEQEKNLPKMPNFCIDDNEEDLNLRMIALRSAVMKKHETRRQIGLKKKQTQNLQEKGQQELMVPRMESPFTASFINDYPLLAEICSPSSPLSKKDSLSVEDMVLDSDMELTAISDYESPYSPSDDIVCEIAESSLYTPSKPTETPCVGRSNDKPPLNDFNGSFLELVNQESRPYSPSDDTIYDPDLPGVHSNIEPPPVLTLTPPQMQNPHSLPSRLHSTSPLQPQPPLQPPPLPPLSMFATSVSVTDAMVLGCPPNMLNPFVDPTLTNFPVNPMMLPPPQLFTPFPTMAQPAPSLPTPASQLDDFGETDLDGSPLVPIEKDGQQQQQQWRLLNEPLYLQDLPPLGEAQMSNVPMLATPNLVPSAVLESNKQLQKQPSRKSPVSDNALFRNAEMIPVLLEPDVIKPCASFKPMKLQPSSKKNVPLQPAAVFNTTSEDPESPRANILNGEEAESPRDKIKSVTPSPRKMSRRERRAAKRANLKERTKTVKIVNTSSEIEQSKKRNDKRRRSSMEDDEEMLRELLLASLAKRVKLQQPDKALSTTEPLTSGTSEKVKENDPKASTSANPVVVEKPKTEDSSANATKQSLASKSNAETSNTVKASKTDSAPILKPTSSMVTTASISIATTTTKNAIEATSSTSSPKTSSSTSSVVTVTTKTTNNLKKPVCALSDLQLLSTKARQTASVKVVNNAKRYQNLLFQRKMSQQKNFKATSTVSRFKVNNKNSLPQRSISPSVARLELNRVIINLNGETESESDQDEAILSPTKERPQLSIPGTEFEVSLNEFLKCAREQHEMAAVTAVTATSKTTTESVAETTPSPPDTEAALNPPQAETTANPSTAEVTANQSTVKVTLSLSTAETTTITTTATSTVAVTTTSSSKISEAAVVTTSSSKISEAAVVTMSPTAPTTSKTEQAPVSTSKVTNTVVATVKSSVSIAKPKVTTITSTPIIKTTETTVTKTTASAAPVKISAGQIATAIKAATTAISKNVNIPKIVKTTVKTSKDPVLTPSAVKHLPAPKLEEYRRLKQKLYEYEKLKKLREKKSVTPSTTATNPSLKKLINNTITSTATLKSPPSLTALALASSTPKAATKPLKVAVSESPVSVTSTSSLTVAFTTSVAAVSTPSVAAISTPSVAEVSTPLVASVSTPSVTAVSAPSVTVVSKPLIVAVSTPSVTAASKSTITAVFKSSNPAITMPPNAAAYKPPVAVSTSSVSTVSVKTATTVTAVPSTSATITKSIVSASKSVANVTSSTNKPLPTVIKTVPKSQLVATISPIAKPSRAETLPRMSPIVVLTPTKIVHSTGSFINHVESVPSKTNKTASVSNVKTSRNITTSNPKASTSSPRIIPQSTAESPTKLLDKMNAALKNQRLQISAVAHKVSSLRILTKEQINHKSSPNQETSPSTSALNLNLSRINKEATSSNNSASKEVVKNLPVTTSNVNKTSSIEVNTEQPPAPSTSTAPDNTNKNWEDFKHEVNNEVQSLTDLATEDQRKLLRDTEERLINKRHLVLDDVTEMSSNLRQWEIERDLQNMLNSEVKKLREQLRIAEEKMERQKEKLSSIQPKVSSFHEKINAGRKECFRLSKICSSLGQEVVGPSYKVPTAGAELLNNRIREVANHTQKLTSKKAQTSGTLKNNDSQKTDKTKLKNNPELNNNTNLRSKELNNRQNNINIVGAPLPNNHNVNININAKNIGIVKSEESTSVNQYDSRLIKEEIITDESSDENVSEDTFNNDATAQSREKNVKNTFSNSESIHTDNSLNSANISNANLTAERLNFNVSNSELFTFSISNNQSENFNSETENLSQNSNIVNQTDNDSNEKTESSLRKEISSRVNNNESIIDEQSVASDVENNVESETLNSESDNNIENSQSEILNQNLLITTHANSVCTADKLNVGSESSPKTSSRIEKSVNENNFEQNATSNSNVDSASINVESDKNLETVNTTSAEDDVECIQQNIPCLESSTSNVNATIEKIKTEPEVEMEIDFGTDSVLQSAVPHAGNVVNNIIEGEQFADSKLKEKIKEANEENGNYQSEFSTVSTGTEHSTLLEEINLLEIANAVEVPNTFTRYSQLFKSKKRTYKKASLEKAENVKVDSKKKKVPRPYESILKHLNAPRNNKINGILCPYELMGTCYDGDCQYVHQSTSHS